MVTGTFRGDPRKLKKKKTKIPDFCLVGVDQIHFHYKEVKILKQHMWYCHIFSSNSLDFSTLSDTNQNILPPIRYNNHFCHFIIEYPSPPPPGWT